MTSAVWWWLRSPNYNNNNNFCNVNNNGNNNNNNAYYSAGVRPGFCDCEVKWSNRNPAFGFQVKDDLRKRRDTSLGSQSLKLPFDALTRTLLAWWGIVPYPISCARAKQIRRHPTIYPYERRILIFMTSQERHEARYQRRKAKRQARKQARCNALGPMEKIFSYRKMFFYGKKCCNGVRWKQSVQNFEGHLFSGTANRRRKVLDQNWKPMKCTHFTLCERGKVRPIDAPHITDRQIHKALCNEVLTPLYGPCMIHDNGASQKGKGLHWHFRRLKEQLHWHYRRYGREGAVLLLDLKGFFPNAPHALLYQRHQELILNPNLRALADTVIQNSPCPTPGRGLPLGVEPSQQEMVALPSAIDNWIKCQAGVHCFGHYMDDYYLIFPDVEALKKLGHEVVRRFEALGIRVNKRKCKIIPLTKPFRFCKARFTLTETGKIKVNGNRDGVKRARRKLKLFHREFLEGKRLLSEVEQFMECQTAYYRNFNDHGRLLRLRRLYHAIFFGGAKCIGSSKTGPTLA